MRPANIFLILFIIAGTALFAMIIVSQKIRHNIQKNISFITALYRGLRFQIKKKSDKAEFEHGQQEQRMRDSDFREFAMTWLQMHCPGSDIKNRAAHVVGENRWVDLAEEKNCLKKMLNKFIITNIPLTLCIHGKLKIPYQLWSKCVEPNTCYFDKRENAIYVNKMNTDSWPHEGRRVIKIDLINKRWKWMVSK